MDSFLGFIDYVLQFILYIGIPFSFTFSIVYYYFSTLPADGGAAVEKANAGDFFKGIIKSFIVALIAWVAIYVVRDLIPAAGSAAVSGLGF